MRHCEGESCETVTGVVTQLTPDETRRSRSRRRAREKTEQVHPHLACGNSGTDSALRLARGTPAAGIPKEFRSRFQLSQWRLPTQFICVPKKTFPVTSKAPVTGERILLLPFVPLPACLQVQRIVLILTLLLQSGRCRTQNERIFSFLFHFYSTH